MQNYRFLFFWMIIGACFVQSSSAMEMVKYDKKDDVALNMHHFRSDDCNKKISYIKNLDLEGMRSSLQGEQFLPAHSDELHHLLYLSTIDKNNTTKTPFTLNQQNKFDACFKIK